MTARSAASKEDLAEILSGRLHALAQANALIRRSFGNDVSAVASFGDLVARILRPHEQGQAALSGPDLAIGEQATNQLALVFHELATNAAKYGALNCDRGSLRISWAVTADAVDIVWNEKGASSVKAPSETGFGTKLVETTIGRIGGKIDREWSRDALRVRISLPLSALRN
ncbi:sensor histidine kinase [Bradyrhizobium vignae]|uniref:histidine kinase n=1 Tax=Bradyrhizobium vignae TaxID=1549949 RepID=A0ABS4A231_9BRAD|nr:sensor histidine kinase [Bradyrhizobium vignae]MBP0114455.1 sensor histidine kinase [Bradyrhizobium vignae]